MLPQNGFETLSFNELKIFNAPDSGIHKLSNTDRANGFDLFHCQGRVVPDSRIHAPREDQRIPNHHRILFVYSAVNNASNQPTSMLKHKVEFLIVLSALAGQIFVIWQIRTPKNSLDDKRDLLRGLIQVDRNWELNRRR